MSALICVFAKPPAPGKVKTRLAATLGDARAAALAQAFVRDTWDLVSAVEGTERILATTELSPAAFGLSGEPELWLQGEGDLGQRLESVVTRGLARAGVVIAIGADTPGLPRALIVEAREQLARTDAVLGPCDDGGFYLLGLRRCPARLFDGVPWSTRKTCAVLRQKLELERMTIGLLDPWFDVDEPQDLERLRVLLAGGRVRAPHTARLLTATRG